MVEVYREVGADSALDTGHAKRLSDGSIVANQARPDRWLDYFCKKNNMKPYQLDANTLKCMVSMMEFNDHDRNKGIFSWTFQQSNNTLAQYARSNFDSAISEQQYASVSQWQSDARQFLKEFIA